MAENRTSTEPKKEDKPIALKLAGAGYILGDVGGLAASHARGNPDSLKGYAVWLAGGLAAAVYGNPSKETRLELTAHKLQNYLSDRGIAIPKDAREQNALLKKPHFLSSVTDFLHEHPSEMLNAMFAVGAGFLIKDGIKEIKKPNLPEALKNISYDNLSKSDRETYKFKNVFPSPPKGLNAEELSKFAKRTNNMLWMGMLVGAGALSGLLIKENPAAREEAKEGNFTDKVLAYIKEKPLRLTSLLYGANNIFAVMQAVSDHHARGTYKGFAGLQPHYFSGTLAASYILSNMLLHSVSRDQVNGGFDVNEMARLEEMAATVIASQPAEKQQEALQQVSTFLATQKNIGLQAPQIAEHLANRIAEKSKAHLLAVQSAPMPVVMEEGPKSFAEKEQARRGQASDQSTERS